MTAYYDGKNDDYDVNNIRAHTYSYNRPVETNFIDFQFCITHLLGVTYKVYTIITISQTGKIEHNNSRAPLLGTGRGKGNDLVSPDNRQFL